MAEFIKTENSPQTEFHETEYSLFLSAYFRLKIVLHIIAYDISVLEYIRVSIVVSAFFCRFVS